jgi:hypothetical protein
MKIFATRSQLCIVNKGISTDFIKIMQPLTAPVAAQQQKNVNILDTFPNSFLQCSKVQTSVAEPHHFYAAMRLWFRLLPHYVAGRKIFNE